MKNIHIGQSLVLVGRSNRVLIDQNILKFLNFVELLDILNGI